MRFDPQRSWQDAIGHFDAGRFAQARALLQALQPLRPNFGPLLHLLGVCEYRIGNSQLALTLMQQALQAAPTLAPALSDYGNILISLGDSSAALRAYQQAVTADPANPGALINLARLEATLGDPDSGIARLDRALSGTPAAHSLRWARGLLSLSYKDFLKGWSDYAVRWQLPGSLFNGLRRDFGLPPDSGNPSDPRPVWLWTEQGIGDEILYATVLPEAMQAGGRFLFGCNQRSFSLLRRSFPHLDIRAVETVVPAQLAGCRGQLPLADLAARHRSSMASFGAGAAILKADPVLTGRLRDHYRRLAGGRKLVGLSWRSTNPFSAEAKSPPLKVLAPLLRTADCVFVNLQYQPGETDLECLRRESGATILDDRNIDPLGDLDPYAAQIAALDAVVSVSNTTVHVAGGLGIPTIVLLPAHTGLMWYWFRTDTRSPWYASLSLVRQSRIGEWADAVAAASAHLGRLLRGEAG